MLAGRWQVRHGRRGLALVGSAVLVAATLAATTATPAAAQALSDSVTVDATAGLGTIPANAIGLNTAVYDGDMNDTPIPGLLKAAGINALRYPGRFLLRHLQLGDQRR